MRREGDGEGEVGESKDDSINALVPHRLLCIEEFSIHIPAHYLDQLAAASEQRGR